MGRRSRDFRSERLRQISEGPNQALTICYGRRYLSDYPECDFGWFLVGIALCKFARYEEAEQAYAKAIQYCRPEQRPVCLAQMGHLFVSAGDYDQAALWYGRAIDADTDNATYHIDLGNVFERQGRLLEAEEAFRAAIGCPDGCVDEAYLKLGFVLRAREEFLEAAEYMREAIRLFPESRSARQALRDVELCLELEEGCR